GFGSLLRLLRARRGFLVLAWRLPGIEKQDHHGKCEGAEKSPLGARSFKSLVTAGLHLSKRRKRDYSSWMTLQNDSLRRAAGLCSDCKHSLEIESARGSAFAFCELSRKNPEFPKYPRLPVLSCTGYERADGATHTSAG